MRNGNQGLGKACRGISHINLPGLATLGETIDTTRLHKCGNGIFKSFASYFDSYQPTQMHVPFSRT